MWGLALSSYPQAGKTSQQAYDVQALTTALVRLSRNLVDPSQPRSQAQVHCGLKLGTGWIYPRNGVST